MSMENSPVGIIRILETIGECHVDIQALNPSICRLARMDNGDTQVTFATSEKFDERSMERIGLIVWTSREDFDAMKKELGICKPLSGRDTDDSS